MKRFIKTTSIWLVIVSILFSLNTSFVFAENADTGKNEETQITLEQSIEKVISSLTVLSRYEKVTKEKLYQVAFEALFEEDPETYEKVLKEVLSSIDEHSVYYNADEASDFLLELNDEVTGIGVNVFMNEGNIIVSQPIPGSPAEKAGIKAGDIIIGADNYDLRGMEFEAALRLKLRLSVPV